MSKRCQPKRATPISKVVRYATRLLLAVTVALFLLGFLSTEAQADTNPVDLELGGEGAMPWSISNVQPGDSSTSTVELHNAGSGDGFITIWVSDIISTEGMNPESETGDTTQPGELANHLLLGISSNRISTNLKLPTTIYKLPQSVTSPNYLEIIPLKSGDTANLQWKWSLPTQTGNDVQGDGISFTINYLLRECSITDVSGVVTGEGVFTEEVTAESESGEAELTIEKDTVGQTEEGQPLSEIWIIEMDKEPPAPPADAKIVGLTCDLGPDGATFDPPITITFTYDPDEIPERASERDLVIAVWDKDTGEWVTLEGCTVDTVNSTISAPVSHFSRYSVIVPIPPPHPPSHPPTGAEEGAPETISLLEVDMLDEQASVEIGADGTLSEPSTLTDRSGNFIIYIDGGTEVTGLGGMELSRIELRITDESIVIPDDIVVLSPIYKLTGYTRSMEVTPINFDPPVKLTIKYDPQNLPENTFLPFIANYTDEQGLIRLQPPLDSTDEIGKAKALISHASLFVVAAEVLPPPPPLPARFEASNLTINPKQAQLGQPVTISVTIINEGATEGSFELHLIIDGIVRIVKEVTLAGKSSETLTFEVSNLAAGKHQVKIAGLAENFKIVRITIPPEESRVNWLLLDISVGAALVIGALVLYLTTRRSRQARLK